MPVYAIVLLPPQEIDKKSIETSQFLEKFGTDFTLNTTDKISHLSLYMANFTPENLEKAMAALKSIAAAAPPLPLQATAYAHDFDQGMFEIGYEKTENLVALQQKIVESLNPLRLGLRAKDPVGHTLSEWIPQLSGEQRENYDAFGYDEIGGLFRPHITFTRFTRRDLEVDTSILPPPEEFSGTFATLALFEMGENGTCVREVAAWKLGAGL